LTFSRDASSQKAVRPQVSTAYIGFTLLLLERVKSIIGLLIILVFLWFSNGIFKEPVLSPKL
jgi:hypothetical protein